MNYPDVPPPQNFDELADWLLTVDSQFSPSELQGAIVGALCGAMRLPGARWAQFGFAVMGSSEATIRQFSGLAEGALGGLAREQFELLSGEDMAFQPYLPDDDETIEQRTEGLSDWSWCPSSGLIDFVMAYTVQVIIKSTQQDVLAQSFPWVGCPPAWLFDFFHRGRYQLVLNPSTGASRLPRLTRLVSIGAVLMHAGSLLTRSIRPNGSALVCGSIVLRASPRTHSAYSHRNSRWLILNRVTNALTVVL